ncbi:hypothetical protein LEP1GSC199_4140 [Leptospira vanthielii serovar Holland str. Waz Holland = ATCC 700522]|uniref:Uncharacterized protein n=1 Tax=Leptospira vanthielii serovar Holland str. Waz Holland = ATCC 700522 TaxID=1218591 RepID=N1WBL1_9LEPT|nr:hypothetical protein LEP1GSC199_4140 [Leptospira vanthielii serovar Holland str. Waz Holland = ATCC 700522]
MSRAGCESIYPRPDLGGELNPPPNTFALPHQAKLTTTFPTPPVFLQKSS